MFSFIRQKVPHVAVVGAGMAGLQACLTLLQQGCRVTLIEGSHRIGGHIETIPKTWPDEAHQPPTTPHWTRRIDGSVVALEHFECGPSFINSDDEKMIALCSQFGVELVTAPNQEAITHHMPGVELDWQENYRTHILPTVKRDKTRLATDRGHGQALDQLSVQEYLEQNAPHASSALRKAIAEMYCIDSGNAPSNTSTLLFVRELESEGKRLLSGDQGWVAAHGLETLVNAMRNYFTSQPLFNRPVQLGTRVTAIAPQADGVNLTLERRDRSSDEHFDAVVFAVPAPALAQIRGLDDYLGGTERALDCQYTKVTKYVVRARPEVIANIKHPNLRSSTGFEAWVSGKESVTFYVRDDAIPAFSARLGLPYRPPIQQYMDIFAASSDLPMDELFVKDAASSPQYQMQTSSAYEAEKNPRENNSIPEKIPYEPKLNFGCYAAPAPGQCLPLFALHDKIPELAKQRIGIAGSFLPLAPIPEASGVGFLENAVVSGKRSAELIAGELGISHQPARPPQARQMM